MSKTITLKKPVNIDGANVSVITLREPNMNDVFNADIELVRPEKITTIQLNKLIANLATWTPDQVGQMSPKDWQACATFALSFLS